MLTVVFKNGQSWLICGGRHFADEAMFADVMSRLMSIRGCPDRIIHGDATGADALANQWAERMAVDVRKFPAAWGDIGHPDALVRTRRDGSRYDARAGVRRNQRMLDEERPDFVVAFPGGNGTADMVARARCAGIDVAEVVPTRKDRET